DLRREVQARCRRRDRTLLTREHCLVAFTIGGFVAALNIRRQRHVTDAFERGPRILVAKEAHCPLPEFATSHDLCFQSAIEADPSPPPHLPPGTHQRLPFATVARHRPQ